MEESSSKLSERMSVRHVNKTMTMSFTRQSHTDKVCSAQFFSSSVPESSQTANCHLKCPTQVESTQFVCPIDGTCRRPQFMSRIINTRPIGRVAVQRGVCATKVLRQSLRLGLAAKSWADC